MAENTLSFENSLNRLHAGLKADTKTERTPEAQGELLSAALDIFYCASGGALWESTGMLSSSQKADKDFPKGTLVTFIPVPLSTNDERQESHKVGIFTFTNSPSGGPTVATIGVECELTDTGHQKLNGQTRFPGVEPNYDIGKIDPNSLVTRVAAMALVIANDFRVPLKK